MSKYAHKEWLNESLREGLIECCSDEDIIIHPMPIGRGAYGVVYKAKMKASGTTVAMKTLFFEEGSCKEDLIKELVKEVS